MPFSNVWELPTATGRITARDIHGLFEKMIAVRWLVFNPRDYCDMHDLVDPLGIELEHRSKAGCLGYLWGASLVQSCNIPYGEVYAIGPGFLTIGCMRVERSEQLECSCAQLEINVDFCRVHGIIV